MSTLNSAVDRSPAGSDLARLDRLTGPSRDQAGYDRLTGLPDRSLFAERVEELLRTSPPDALVGLCFLDLDPSGPVDDQSGCPVRDRLLIAMTRRLSGSRAVRGNLLARLGDDEFAVLVSGPGLMPGAAAEVGGQLVQMVAAPFRVGEYELSVSGNVGVVERVVAETTYADLLSSVADLRIRQAKAGNRAGWIAVDLDRARAIVRP